MIPKNDITPEEAKKITQLRQNEVESLRDRVDRVVDSLKGFQRENGFAPRMEILFRGSK